MIRLTGIAVMALVMTLGSARAVRADLESYMGFIYDAYADSKVESGFPGLEIYTSELNAAAGMSWHDQDHRTRVRGNFLFNWLNLDFGSFATNDSLPRFDKAVFWLLEGEYRKRLNDSNWGGQARLAMGTSGDLDTSSGEEAFVAEGGLWFLWFSQRHWTLGGGAVRTFVFGKPQVLPSVIAEYESNPWRVRAELPLIALAEYNVGGNFHVGALAMVTGMRYARDPDVFAETNKPTLAYSETTVGVTGSYEFDPRLRLMMELGYAFNRILRYKDGDETLVNLDMESSPAFRAVLTWGGN